MTEITDRRRTGFVLSAVVAFCNIPLAFVPTDDKDGGPPVGVMIFGAVAAVVILALLRWAYVSGKAAAIRIAAGLMVLVALSAVPAFFVDGVPVWAQLAAGAYIVATVISLSLLFAPSRQHTAVLD